MLFQTIVQLNILIAAAPALAGWLLVSPQAQPLPMRAVVAYYAAADAAAPVQAEQRQTAGQRAVRPARSLCLTPGSCEFAEENLPGRLQSTPVAMTRFSPFPHATRAP